MYRLHFTFDESAIWMMHFGKDVQNATVPRIIDFEITNADLY